MISVAGDAETVVKTIIALGRELHIRVTIEGVETGKQAAFLDRANGDQVQRFFFGRPIPACEVDASIVAYFQQTLRTPSSATAQGADMHLVKSSAE
jgi:EAL domain-containing protein (putative c-di-GMP-specific phosphodiesterase class I)